MIKNQKNQKMFKFMFYNSLKTGQRSCAKKLKLKTIQMDGFKLIKDARGDKTYMDGF